MKLPILNISVIFITNNPTVAIEADGMVEHRDIRPTSAAKKVKRRTTAAAAAVLSPPSLPPRWGEGVAPPTTPQFASTPQSNTPETSPEYNPHNHHPRLSQQPPPTTGQGPSTAVANDVPHYPSSGAELLEDLHRRLQAQSIQGTRLPTRPRTSGGATYRHKHRTRSHHHYYHRTSSALRSSAKNTVTTNLVAPPSSQISQENVDEQHHHNQPMPDLLPSSAWNNPSRHTQYQLIPEQHEKRGNSQPVPLTTANGGGGGTTGSLPTSDYSSTSPISSTMSESPPLVAPAATILSGSSAISPPPPALPPPPGTATSPVPPVISTLPLSIPSPPLQRGKIHSQPPMLTSTMLATAESHSPPRTPQLTAAPVVGSSSGPRSTTSSEGGGGGGPPTTITTSSSGQNSAGHPTSPASPPPFDGGEVSAIVGPPNQGPLDETTYQNFAQE